MMKMAEKIRIGILGYGNLGKGVELAIRQIHWHLTDDQGWRIEIKKYPELTTVGSIRKKTMIRKEWDNYDNTPYGGYYTQDEIRDIVAISVISASAPPTGGWF